MFGCRENEGKWIRKLKRITWRMRRSRFFEPESWRGREKEPEWSVALAFAV